MSATKSPKTRTKSGEILTARGCKIKLHSAEEIRAEMARVYREARTGRLASDQATRLVYILGQIAKVHELGIIESRFTALEQIAKVDN